jgi:OOP family OmpA-OmpF porin
MPNSFRPLIAALPLLLAGAASHAAEPYIGLNLATPGETRTDFGNGTKVLNDNNPTAWKLYAGADVNDWLGVEAGIGLFGSWHTANPAPGAQQERTVASRLVYAAARGAVPLGQSLSLVGKLGLAANHLERSGTGLASGSTSFVRPMLGAGVDYQLSRQAALVLEFDYYGKAKATDVGMGDFTQRKLEAGLRWHF